MRAIIAGLTLIIALGSVSSAEAKGKKKKAKAAAKKVPAAATKETTVAIDKLMGAYKWGLSLSAILGQLEKDIRAEMEPVIKNTADPLAQDRVRREMMDKIKALRASVVKFEGKATPWDVSLVDKEFGHRNDESMVQVWDRKKKDRKFYFFYHDRLWKMFIAFNAELYEGKTFEDFAQAMESRFGRAERKFKATLKGEQRMSHLEWPPSPTTILRAIDNTELYGNFCLVLSDRNTLPAVRAGRKANSPRKDYGDPLIDAVTKGGGTDSGQTLGEDGTSDTDAPAPVPGNKGKKGAKVNTDDASPPPAKNKRVNPKNPLDGLDI